MALRIMRSMPAHPGGDLEIRPAAQGKSIDLAFTLAAANGGEHRLAAGQTHGLADVWPDRAQPGLSKSMPDRAGSWRQARIE